MLSQTQKRSLVGFAALLFFAAIASFLSIEHRGGPLGEALIAAIAASGLFLHSTVRHHLMQGATLDLKRLSALAVFLAAGVGFLAIGRISERDGYAYFGVVCLYVGLGLIVAELRRSSYTAPRVGALFAVFSAVGLVIGGRVLPDSPKPGAIWIAFGVSMLFAALSLLSANANRYLKTWSFLPIVVLLVVSSVVFVLMLVVVRTNLELSWRYVAPVGLAVLVLLIGTASRSNSDVVIVVAAIALLLAINERTVPDREPPNATSVIVALGDSFMSGEGADKYFEGTNVRGKNECRRAPSAYANRLVTQPPAPLPYGLVFVACSGDNAIDIPDQLTEATAHLRARSATFALLSIGGNDALFGWVAKACLLPGDCSDLGPAWHRGLTRLPEALRPAYRAVRDALPDTPVLVVPYPIPVAEEKRSCGYTTFIAQEHRFLHDFALRLNAVIEKVVGEEEFRPTFRYVDTIPDSLVGARLCDGPPGDVGVNFFAAHGVGGLIEQSVNPTNWIHNSMHPNATGHNAMREAVKLWLAQHPDLTAPPAIADPVPPLSSLASAAGTSPCVEAAAVSNASLEECTKSWTLHRATSFVQSRGVYFLLPLLGGWVVALALVRLTRLLANTWMDAICASRK